MNSQPDKEEAADTVLNALLPFLKAASKREPSGETGKIFIPDSKRFCGVGDENVEGNESESRPVICHG